MQQSRPIVMQNRQVLLFYAIPITISNDIAWRLCTVFWMPEWHYQLFSNLFTVCANGYIYLLKCNKYPFFISIYEHLYQFFESLITCLSRKDRDVSMDKTKADEQDLEAKKEV